VRASAAIACIALGGSVGCADVLGLDRYDPEPSASSSTGAGSGGGGGSPTDTSYAAVIMGHHPMAYWRLGDAMGEVAHDELETYNGTYTSELTLGEPGLISGDANTAVRFHGASSPGISMTADFLFGGVPSFTLEAWVQNDNVATGATLFSTRIDDAPPTNMTEGYALSCDANVVRFERISNGMSTSVAGPAMAMGQPTHVVARFDDDLEQICIFINGAQAQCVTDMGVLVGRTEQKLVVGKTLNGVMDEVVVYAIALEDDLILAHYQAGAVE
jgi:hypothetical protein